ncbi:MAG: hypothetical protein JWP35_2713 [Caulobacter sp.]|nr:hypothetical protein [Caulobacter sp.]
MSIKLLLAGAAALAITAGLMLPIPHATRAEAQQPTPAAQLASR